MNWKIYYSNKDYKGTVENTPTRDVQVFAHLRLMRQMLAEEAGIGRGALEAGVIDLDFMEKSGDA